MDVLYEKELVEARHDAIFSAVASGLINTTTLLLARDRDIDVNIRIHGETLLHVACSGGHVHVAHVLIDHGGVDIDVLNSCRRATPLDELAHYLRLQRWREEDIVAQVTALRLAHLRRGNWGRRKALVLAMHAVKASEGCTPSVRVLTQRDLIRQVAQFL